MNAISPAKANHLFWLGRYAERVFAQLHFLRRYYDKCLDEDQEDALEEYCRRLSLGVCPHDRDLFLLQHLFSNDPGSLRYCLNCLNDNSIVLREELSTATISYVNLCVATLKHCDHNKDINIVSLQPITDFILSFWGSALQNVSSRAALDMLFIGKHVEFIDIHTRFSTPFQRIAAEWTNLEHHFERMNNVVDEVCRKQLKDIFADGREYGKNLSETLQALNSLVIV